MSRVIATMNVTVDGCCDHTQVIADAELLRYATQLLRTADSVLFGRVTYELFRAFWPAVAKRGDAPAGEAEFARELEDKPKYVVTRTAAITGWNTATLDAVHLSQSIAALRSRIAGHIVLFGSPLLLRSLLELHQVDELHLLVQPIAAGRGPYLFEGLGEPLTFELIEARPFRSGVVLLRSSPRTSRA